MNQPFVATHEITWNSAKILVMEVDNACYTLLEWHSHSAADWEFDNGELKFQGRIPMGEYSWKRK